MELSNKAELKLANRQLILDATAKVFKEKGYPLTSVEDIITHAKITRTTFYKHFKGKLAVAEALVETMSEQLEDAYDQIGSVAQPDIEEFVRWLYLVWDIFEKNKDLFDLLAHLFTFEPRLQRIAQILNRRRIRMLGKSMSAFRNALPKDADPEIRDGAYLLIQEVDMIFFGIIIRGWQIDRDGAIRFLARQMHNFLVQL